VAAQHLDWDGTNFGFNVNRQWIPKFQGTKKITDLEAFPLKYHPDVEGVKQGCIARGRKWEALCGYHFKHYKGVAETYIVDSRVIIDAAAYNESHSPVSVDSLEDDDEDDEDVMSTSDNFMEEGFLNSSQLLLACTSLRGYSLKDNKWLALELDCIKDITWNDKAFPSFILPDETKDLVLAFAQSQLKSE
jgi:hypothetical protein